MGCASLGANSGLQPRRPEQAGTWNPNAVIVAREMRGLTRAALAAAIDGDLDELIAVLVVLRQQRDADRNGVPPGHVAREVT